MPILIVSCLILQLNLDPIIHDTRTAFYFCRIPCCKTSFGQRFLDQELMLLFGGMIYRPHCLMSLGDLTFHGLYIITYLMFDLLCIVFLL